MFNKVSQVARQRWRAFLFRLDNIRKYGKLIEVRHAISIGIIIAVAVFLGFLRNSEAFRERLTAPFAKIESQPAPSPPVDLLVTPSPTPEPTPSPTPEPTPQPTPWPTPNDVTIYVWFNYKFQKANQSEWLFYYGHTKGGERHNLVKCKLNKEYVAGLIEKEAEVELAVPFSKCRMIEP